jgi:hypothetical protein
VFLEADIRENAGQTISLELDAHTGTTPPRLPRRRHPRPHAVPRYPTEDRTGPPTSAKPGRLVKRRLTRFDRDRIGGPVLDRVRRDERGGSGAP